MCPFSSNQGEKMWGTGGLAQISSQTPDVACGQHRPYTCSISPPKIYGHAGLTAGSRGSFSWLCGSLPHVHPSSPSFPTCSPVPQGWSPLNELISFLKLLILTFTLAPSLQHHLEDLTAVSAWDSTVSADHILFPWV